MAGRRFERVARPRTKCQRGCDSCLRPKSREQKAHAFGRAGARFISGGEGTSGEKLPEGTGLHKRSAEGWEGPAVFLLMHRGVSPNA